ncbi:hypothetical protein [Halorussus salinisoli]|uniref:hypothetical protein n=1 Tax=Halorussus salinisoli TaxID=2558242 RepID=UPI0010C209A2|nr:hypothetical protein [Halorussus salinisoli]
MKRLRRSDTVEATRELTRRIGKPLAALASSMIVSLPWNVLALVVVGWLGTLFLVWSLLYAGRRRERVSNRSSRH